MKRLASILISCTIIEAIQTVRPGAEWKLNGDKYSGLVWLDANQTKPTVSEIVSAIQDCQTEAINRAAAKAQARVDVKDTTLTQAQRLAALLILLDYDE